MFENEKRQLGGFENRRDRGERREIEGSSAISARDLSELTK
jgi:hypothetical protein